MKYCLLFYVLWRWRLFWCFHTAFNIYAKKTGLFHFNVTFVASPGPMSLLRGIRRHDQSGTEGALLTWNAWLSAFADDCVFCVGVLFWFFSIKSVENCSGGHETFLYFYLLWYGIFFVKAICDWHLKMNNSKRLNWNYMGLFCKQISELVYSVKIRWR